MTPRHVHPGGGGVGPLVAPEWVRERIGDPQWAIVDCRWSIEVGPKRAEYEAGHLPGAVFADVDADLSGPITATSGRHPLPSPEHFADAMGRLGIGDDTTVIVYDDTGGLTAARLWWMLDAIGHDVHLLDGGLAAWTGPFETRSVTPTPSPFTPVAWPDDRHVTKAALSGELNAGRAILDARPVDRFASGGAIDPRPGHIPGARNRPVTDNLVDGRFREASELRAAFDALEGDADGTILYCGSGVTACANFLARRIAGLPDARIYVGSWSEWGADPTLPAETGPIADR